VPVHQDIYPDCGPLGGIYTALYHSNHSRVAILPCDIPLLDPTVHQILLEQMVPDRPIVAVSERGPEPLVSIWPVIPSFAVIEKNLKNKYFSIQKTLRELQAVHQNIPACMADYQPEIFMNINYQEDLWQLEFILRDNHVR
jgi:molybdopterin-guanine dinucleotide biosynthesis protein A